MRPARVYAFAAAIIVSVGYVGLVWLDSATTLDVAARPRHAATSPNETTAPKPVATAQERSSGSGQNVAWREASEAELASSTTHRDEIPGASAAASTSAGNQAGSDHSKATASSSDQQANDPPAGGCMPIGVTSSGTFVFPLQCRELLARYSGGPPDARPEPTPAAQAQPVKDDREAVDAVRDRQAVNVPAIPPPVHPMPQARLKAAKPGGLQRSAQSRNDRPSHQRLARLLKDPLALTCMACVLVGP